MKVSELNQIIDEAVNNEIKKTILEEIGEGKKVVYHIKCEGVPLATFPTEEEAMEHLPKYKADHKGELIIEKGVYESHDDMMEKFDELNDQLEETDNMENTQMDEKLLGKQAKLDKNNNGKLDAQDFKMLRKDKNEDETTEGNEFSGALAAAKASGDDSFEVDGKEYPVQSNEEEECNECGQMEEEKQMCSECGGMLNEEGVCNECGGMMNEESASKSKKKSVRLTESQLINVIKKIVKESVPGLNVYKKAHEGSGKENKQHINDVTKKMKDYLSFEGNDNPEFPNQISKGDKMAINNTKEEDEWVDKNRGRGMEDLEYDHEPSENFKKRMKMAIEGDKLMGNESKDAGNVVQKKETAERILKAAKDKKEEKENRVLYPKEKVPVSTVNESKVNFSSVLNEEIEKMRRIQNYNKKTQ